MITITKSKLKVCDTRLSFAWFYFWSDEEKHAFEAEKLARAKPFIGVPEPAHKPEYYGTKAWANWVLVHCIEEIFNKNRVLFARQQEIYYFMGELERLGFWWQVERLRNWIHVGIKKGMFYAEGDNHLVEELS